MLEALGWVATSLFAISYLLKTRQALQIIQASSAALWIGYGIAIDSSPVIVANVIIIASALYSTGKSLLRKEKAKLA